MTVGAPAEPELTSTASRHRPTYCCQRSQVHYANQMFTLALYGTFLPFSFYFFIFLMMWLSKYQQHRFSSFPSSLNFPHVYFFLSYFTMLGNVLLFFILLFFVHTLFLGISSWRKIFTVNRIFLLPYAEDALTLYFYVFF